MVSRILSLLGVNVQAVEFTDATGAKFSQPATIVKAILAAADPPRTDLLGGDNTLLTAQVRAREEVMGNA